MDTKDNLIKKINNSLCKVPGCYKLTKSPQIPICHEHWLIWQDIWKHGNQSRTHFNQFLKDNTINET